MIRSFLSLKRSQRTLRQSYRYYLRKSKKLDPATKGSIEHYLTTLRAAILQKDSEEASKLSQELEQTSLRLMPKTMFDKALDFIGKILFALLVAVLIRTTWFELYTIPSGSMRPTLKEDDYLVVSKTDYGINVPLQEKHFYFDPDLVQRGSIIVFNGANMDIADSDTVYFYLFPGKKQFVKRLIGKPGDILYFYGGQIYGIDAAGNPLTDLTEINRLEHIPFIRFDGKVEIPQSSKNGIFQSTIFHQMNLPIARLNLNPLGKISGEMISQRSQPAPPQYGDLWGIKHFAMARLLTPADLSKVYPKLEVEKGLLYLELTHHPLLQGAHLIRDEYNRLRPDLAVSTSIIPLQQRHLEKISQHMTTCRFSVKNGVAWRVGWNPKELVMYLPHLSDVADGTYEIQDGKAYKLLFPHIPLLGIFSNGIVKELPSDHPLYSQEAENIYKLYDLGIEFLDQYLPTSKQQRIIPSRYAYFRNGDLYLLGAPILSKGDSTLVQFQQREEEKKALSTSIHPYYPFIDSAPPTLEEIRRYGIQVPEKMYFALGDNHALSADSRQFGFIPEDNLKGGVSFIFSPPGDRFGKVPQPSKLHLTVPNLVVWSFFLCATLATSLYYRRKLKNPLKF